MSNHTIIDERLQSAHEIASKSGHSLLVYLIEMALIENAALQGKNYEDKNQHPAEKTSRTTLRIISNR